MPVAIAFLVVVLIVVVWIVSTRDARRRWVTQLDLPGTWDLETSGSEDPPCSIWFGGNEDAGTFVVQSIDETTEGQWRISGSTLVLADEEHGDREYSVRLFEHGTIGIHGPARERQVFVKRSENIVPLRRHS